MPIGITFSANDTNYIDKLNQLVAAVDAATIGGTFVTISAQAISAAAAAFKIISGGTSVSVRNNIDTQDNLLITDAGVISTRGAATTSGAQPGDIVLPNGKNLRASDSSGVTAIPLIGAAGAGAALVLGGQTNSLDTGNLPRVAYWNAASLPAGAVGFNGTIAVDGTNNRFCWYSGNSRFYIAGTAF
jgi:hypothetical protein